MIAIDQRSGGDMFGHVNETVRGLGASTPYLAAMPDLEATLAYAERTAPHLPIVLVGSSYSSALVILLAARHPEVAAVASFSPGEYFEGVSVADAAARIRTALFVTSSPAPAEVASAHGIVSACHARIVEQFVPRIGVHGASTLRSDRDPGGAGAVWAAFEAFLDRAVPRT